MTSPPGNVPRSDEQDVVTGPREDTGVVETPDSVPVIEADGVTVTLGRLPVLRSVSLRVAAGEAVALLGTNGSGKTTLVRALLGILGCDRGEVRLFGVPLAQFRDWPRVGYVPQRAAVGTPQATVGEIAMLGRLGRRRPFARTTSRDRSLVADALAQVGMADHATQAFGRLSGGQQQRVLIARALASQAELLIMDEPFAGVDLATQAALADILAGLKTDGITQLVVLHEMAALAGVVDREIVLRDGRVLPPGAPHLDPHGHEVTPPTPPPLVSGTDRGLTWTS